MSITMATTEDLEKLGFHIENAVLQGAGLSDVNGVICVGATLQFEYGGASFGGCSCGQFDPSYGTIRGTKYGMEAILWFMAVAGVDSSDDLGGQYIRVATKDGGAVVWIGHILKDIWFNLEKLRDYQDEATRDSSKASE